MSLVTAQGARRGFIAFGKYVKMNLFLYSCLKFWHQYDFKHISPEATEILTLEAIAHAERSNVRIGIQLILLLFSALVQTTRPIASFNEVSGSVKSTSARIRSISESGIASERIRRALRIVSESSVIAPMVPPFVMVPGNR